jgi:hypothetical protein
LFIGCNHHYRHCNQHHAAMNAPLQFVLRKKPKNSPVSLAKKKHHRKSNLALFSQPSTVTFCKLKRSLFRHFSSCSVHLKLLSAVMAYSSCITNTSDPPPPPSATFRIFRHHLPPFFSPMLFTTLIPQLFVCIPPQHRNRFCA